MPLPRERPPLGTVTRPAAPATRATAVSPLPSPQSGTQAEPTTPRPQSVSLTNPNDRPGEAGKAVYERVSPNGMAVFSNEPASDQDRLVLPSAANKPFEWNVDLDDLLPNQRSGGGTAATAPAGGIQRPMLPQLDRLIAVIAHQHGVDPHLVRAVIEVESSFDPNARSPKGATGLMQLMPGTALRYNSRNPLDPVQNVDAGTRYLRDLLQMFNGDMRLALAGYNAGEGAVLKYKRQIPPYPETMDYVPKVIAVWQRNRTDPKLPRLVIQAQGTVNARP